MYIKLTPENFVQFAMKYYNNPQCYSVEEFNEDLKRFLYVKKLLSRYTKSGELNERLILNHLITIFNCFRQYAVPMLFFKVEREDWNSLKTFLVFLNQMPIGKHIPGTNVSNSSINLNQKIIDILRHI